MSSLSKNKEVLLSLVPQVQEPNIYRIGVYTWCCMITLPIQIKNQERELQSYQQGSWKTKPSDCFCSNGDSEGRVKPASWEQCLRCHCDLKASICFTHQAVYIIIASNKYPGNKFFTGSIKTQAWRPAELSNLRMSRKVQCCMTKRTPEAYLRCLQTGPSYSCLAKAQSQQSSGQFDLIYLTQTQRQEQGCSWTCLGKIF